MTVSACVAPMARLTVAGAAAIDVSVGVAAVTVTAALALWPATVAVMVALPGATPVTTPAALTLAMVASDDAKVAFSVSVVVEPSAKVPVTVRPCVPPATRLTVAGVTVIEVSAALVTVMVAVALCPDDVAVMVALPGATPVTTPPWLTVAMAAAEVVHTASVMACVAAVAALAGDGERLRVSDRDRRGRRRDGQAGERSLPAAASGSGDSEDGGQGDEPRNTAPGLDHCFLQ